MEVAADMSEQGPKAKARFHIVALAILFAALGSLQAQAPDPEWRPESEYAGVFDWMQMTSGKWVKGEIIAMYDESLEFDSDEFDDLTLDWEDVQQIHTSQVMSVGFEHGASTAGAGQSIEPPTVESTNDGERRGAERILIKNVHLIGRQGKVGDLLVNILIIDGKLDVVTQDDISLATPTIALDAESGFLMGRLQLGSPPSFVILDRNPREDFDVILDTAAHVRFAMDKGVIVKNDLPDVSVEPVDTEAKRRRWMAYSPPPLAVPLDYFDSRKWNKFETKPVSGLFNGAVALDRLDWLTQDDAGETQVGDLSEFEGGEIRALRFGVVGTFNFRRPWVYTVYVATNAFDKGFDTETTEQIAWYDYRLDIPLPAKLNLSIGKQKEPISLERLTPLTFLPWQERASPADAFLPARNHGVVLNGMALRGRSTWAVGVFNNWIDSGASIDDTTTLLVGRVTGVPLRSQDESNLLHLGLGLRRSNARQDPRARTEAEFNQSPVFVDTGPIPADGALTYDLETYWRRGPYLLGFEFIGSDVDATDSDDLRFHGFHVSGSWAITGEMRPYRKRSGIFDPLPVARPVNQGGWGALEAGFRYSSLDLSDGDLDGGEMDTWSIGLNWWLTRSAQFSVNYRYILLDRFGVDGNSSGINARLTLILD